MTYLHQLKNLRGCESAVPRAWVANLKSHKIGLLGNASSYGIHTSSFLRMLIIILCSSVKFFDSDIIFSLSALNTTTVKFDT